MRSAGGVVSHLSQLLALVRRTRLVFWLILFATAVEVGLFFLQFVELRKSSKHCVFELDGIGKCEPNIREYALLVV